MKNSKLQVGRLALLVLLLGFCISKGAAQERPGGGGTNNAQVIANAAIAALLAGDNAFAGSNWFNFVGYTSLYAAAFYPGVTNQYVFADATGKAVGTNLLTAFVTPVLLQRGTNLSSYASLTNALDASAPGDVIRLGIGTNWIQNYTLTNDLTIIGLDPQLSWLVGTNEAPGLPYAMKLNNGVTLKNFSIMHGSTNGYGQTTNTTGGLILITAGGLLTNVWMENLHLFGMSDTFTGGSLVGTIANCYVETHNLGIDFTGAGNDLNIINTTIFANYQPGRETAQIAVVPGSGKVRIANCLIIATNGTSTRGIYFATSDSELTISGTRIQVGNTNASVTAKVLDPAAGVTGTTIIDVDDSLPWEEIRTLPVDTIVTRQGGTKLTATDLVLQGTNGLSVSGGTFKEVSTNATSFTSVASLTNGLRYGTYYLNDCSVTNAGYTNGLFAYTFNTAYGPTNYSFAGRDFIGASTNNQGLYFTNVGTPINFVGGEIAGVDATGTNVPGTISILFKASDGTSVNISSSPWIFKGRYNTNITWWSITRGAAGTFRPAVDNLYVGYAPPGRSLAYQVGFNLQTNTSSVVPNVTIWLTNSDGRAIAVSGQVY